MIARVGPRLPDMILASSGEEDFFVKKSRKAAFEPKTFLAKVGDGKTITEYHKDQVVFWQRTAGGRGFLHPEGQDQAHRRFRAAQGSSRRNSGSSHFSAKDVQMAIRCVSQRLRRSINA